MLVALTRQTIAHWGPLPPYKQKHGAPMGKLRLHVRRPPMPQAKHENTLYKRDWRAKQAARERITSELPSLFDGIDDLSPDNEVHPPPPASPREQVAALAEWSRATLRIPPGHPASGEPLVLPGYAIDFLNDALSRPESLLCMARKNAKSAICAVLALGYLAGPLKRRGWRGAVASVSKEKANELRMQVEDIAVASRLPGLLFRRSPQPGSIESEWGALEVLAAERSAGHASGFDLVLIDELGLFPERYRELVAGLRSSTSARGGRVMCISVRGDSPMLQEILDRRAAPGTAVHLYETLPNCALDDRAAWQAANPGLGTIKQVSYMEAESARVALAPADQPAFRAYDLNARLNPAKSPILTVDQWTACETDDVPPRSGACVVGFDAGGSASMTAAALYWPQTGRMEGYGAFPRIPDLLVRGRADGIATAYQVMQADGDLHIFGNGEVTDVSAFLTWLAADVLQGVQVAAIGADRYRQAEVRTALADAGLHYKQVWRGTGASKTADGSHDVRAFQNAALTGKVKVRPSRLWTYAVGNSDVRTDAAGNPALDKSGKMARIDVLQAGVIACGLAAIAPPTTPRRRVIIRN